ncbi:MAG: hypothetical protein J5797_07815 [Prevotella sp.]|nr:hypothetical protein [Prevotella sp.]
MITQERKQMLKKYRKLISADPSFSKEEKEIILDVLNKLSWDFYKKSFSLRIQLRQVKLLLNKPEHSQAKKHFVHCVYLLGKREVAIDVFSQLSNWYNKHK